MEDIHVHPLLFGDKYWRWEGGDLGGDQGGDQHGD